MSEQIRGKIWKFGENLNTDVMYPAAIMHGKQPKDKMRFFCMQAIRPEFPYEVKPGDILLAGANCGCGSSRPAPSLLKELGISCVIADSFGALFFRNCISVGLPVIESSGISDLFTEGDTAEVDLRNGVVRNLTTGTVIEVQKMPDEIMDIIAAGGMLEFIEKDLSLRG